MIVIWGGLAGIVIGLSLILIALELWLGYYYCTFVGALPPGPSPRVRATFHLVTAVLAGAVALTTGYLLLESLP